MIDRILEVVNVLGIYMRKCVAMLPVIVICRFTRLSLLNSSCRPAANAILSLLLFVRGSNSSLPLVPCVVALALIHCIEALRFGGTDEITQASAPSCKNLLGRMSLPPSPDWQP